MAFYVGQKVVCVDDDFLGNEGPEIFPQKGVVYTVRELVGGRYQNDATYLRLVEIVNKRRWYRDRLWRTEPCFTVEAFRPLTDTKKSTETGMEILREIVRNPKTPARSKQPEYEVGDIDELNHASLVPCKTGNGARIQGYVQ
ncbi:MAG: hypothetical protein JJ939_16050 [Alphaproteobacteria bacterium]|nr:hypothetical protein [Alphaproteobacteria bacterium]MBO6629927.1 hypothetical protein [Alphaproteobacteria bacterium]